MSNKMTLLLFSVTVLLVSSAVVAIPQANALTKSNVMTWISTASYGNDKVCGDHKCTPGEHTKWTNAVWQSQKVNSGKIGTTYHGEDVMHKLAGSTSTSTSSGNTEAPITGYK